MKMSSTIAIVTIVLSVTFCIVQRWPFKTSKTQTTPLRNPASPSLPWPIALDGGLTYLGNTEVQFQHFSEEWVNYFHSGCDLVAPAGTIVKSPVNGGVFAGYNTHKINPVSRLLESHWVPYHEAVEDKESPYTFGISVTDKSKTRFEMVHIDPASVPPEIFEAAKANLEIEGGAVIGQVIAQPKQVLGHAYHHIHYTIVRQDGLILNCQGISKPLADNIPPTISAVYGIFRNGARKIELNSKSNGGPVSEFIVDTFDNMNENPMPLQPPYVELQINGESVWRWDFSTALQSSDTSKVLKIADVILEKLPLASGERIASQGNFDSRKFLIRLPVKSPITGTFTILVKDMGGNETSFSSEIGK